MEKKVLKVVNICLCCYIYIYIVWCWMNRKMEAKNQMRFEFSMLRVVPSLTMIVKCVHRLFSWLISFFILFYPYFSFSIPEVNFLPIICKFLTKKKDKNELVPIVNGKWIRHICRHVIPSTYFPYRVRKVSKACIIQPQWCRNWVCCLCVSTPDNSPVTLICIFFVHSCKVLLV